MRGRPVAGPRLTCWRSAAGCGASAMSTCSAMPRTQACASARTAAASGAHLRAAPGPGGGSSSRVQEKDDPAGRSSGASVALPHRCGPLCIPHQPSLHDPPEPLPSLQLREQAQAHRTRMKPTSRSAPAAAASSPAPWYRAIASSTDARPGLRDLQPRWQASSAAA